MSADAETWEIVERWISKALLDVAAGQAVVEQTEAWTVAAYCAEQAAERALKALLTLHGIHAPRTHDIEHLNALLPAGARVAVSARELAYLSTYGIDPWWEPDREQAERALEIAARVCDHASLLLRAERAA